MKTICFDCLKGSNCRDKNKYTKMKCDDLLHISQVITTEFLIRKFSSPHNYYPPKAEARVSMYQYLTWQEMADQINREILIKFKEGEING